MRGKNPLGRDEKKKRNPVGEIEAPTDRLLVLAQSFGVLEF